MYRIQISCLDPKKNIINLIINYFEKYKLKTTKSFSFNIWKEILNITLNNQPLSSEVILNIRKKRKNMNKFHIFNKPIGHSNKS